MEIRISIWKFVALLLFFVPHHRLLLLLLLRTSEMFLLMLLLLLLLSPPTKRNGHRIDSRWAWPDNDLFFCLFFCAANEAQVSLFVFFLLLFYFFFFEKFPRNQQVCVKITPTTDVVYRVSLILFWVYFFFFFWSSAHRLGDQ